MKPLKRRSAAVLLAPLAALAFAPASPAATPTSYGAQQAHTSLPSTSVDLDVTVGPSDGDGSGRRIH